MTAFFNNQTPRLNPAQLAQGPTGVEMEALCAVQVGLLTIYDMCKPADGGMVIDGVQVVEKRGGKSGHWVADGPAPGG